MTDNPTPTEQVAIDAMGQAWHELYLAPPPLDSELLVLLRAIPGPLLPDLAREQTQ